jgi:hypothetical protein
MNYIVSSKAVVLQVALGLFPVRRCRSFRGSVVCLVEEVTGRHMGTGLVVQQVGEKDELSHLDSELRGTVLMHPALFNPFGPFGEYDADGRWWCIDRTSSSQVRLRRWNVDEGKVVKEGPLVLAQPVSLTSVRTEDLYAFWVMLSDATTCKCDGSKSRDHSHSLISQNAVMWRDLQGVNRLVNGSCFDLQVHRSELKRSDVVVDGRTIPVHGRVEVLDRAPIQIIADEKERQQSAG